MSAAIRDIDCAEAMAQLYEYLDGELTPERATEVRRHFEKCVPCLQLARFEDGFLKFLEARVRARNAPPELHHRIFNQLFRSAEGPSTEPP